MNLLFNTGQILDFERYFLLDFGTEPRPGDPFVEIIRKEYREFARPERSKWMIAYDGKVQPDRAVGFVSAAFVHDWVVDDLLNHDHPWVMAKLRRWVEEGRQPYCDWHDIAKGNAGAGNNLVTIHLGWDHSLSLNDASLVKSEVLASYAEHYNGIRYRTMLVEAIGDAAQAECLNAGYRPVNHYESWIENNPQEAARPILFALDYQSALDGHNYFMKRLFAYKEPLFFFTEGQRDVLNYARLGYPDRLIADFLNMGSDAIKARWKQIYLRVDAVMPNVLPAGDSDSRGPEKRRVLLNLLKGRPSEFWPYHR